MTIQHTLPLPPTADDLPLEDTFEYRTGLDATEPMTSCAVCGATMLQRDTVDDEREHFCSVTCQDDYQRF